VVRVLERVAATLPGCADTELVARGLALELSGFDHISPLALLPAAALAAALAVALGRASRRSHRSLPAWGCGGELSADHEYTATAFARPLVMVFQGIYRPTQQISTVERAPYFPSEVRYRSQIGAPFERYVYAPATRAVMGIAGRMRVIQDGSLHAYLGYVLVLGVILLWWLGGLP
jgi:hypothetical protein